MEMDLDTFGNDIIDALGFVQDAMESGDYDMALFNLDTIIREAMRYQKYIEDLDQ